MIRNNVLAFVFHFVASVVALICSILIGALFSQYHTAVVIAIASVFGIIVYLLYILFGYFVLKKQKSWIKDLLSLTAVLVFCLIIWVISLTPVTKRSYDGSLIYESDMSVYIVSTDLGLNVPLLLLGGISKDKEIEKYLLCLLSLLPYMALFLGIMLKNKKFMNRLFKKEIKE